MSYITCTLDWLLNAIEKHGKQPVLTSMRQTKIANFPFTADMYIYL
jgi:hypothetical protein